MNNIYDFKKAIEQKEKRLEAKAKLFPETYNQIIEGLLNESNENIFRMKKMFDEVYTEYIQLSKDYKELANNYKELLNKQ